MVVLSTLLRAQTSDFPSTPAEFYPAFVKFLEDADKKAFKEQIAAFELVWNDPNFEGMKQPFVDVAQAMGKKKMRPDPNFKNLVDATLNFHQATKPKTEFENWTATVTWVIKNKSQSACNDYLAFSANLFKGNYIHVASGHSWQLSSHLYVINPVVDNVSISFTGMDLICRGHGDSTLIEGTSATFYPLDEKLQGTGGRIYWTRGGMDKEQVYADFSTYTIPLNRAYFRADSVLFTNTEYFSEPLYGQVEEKLKDTPEGGSSSYPKFDSYNKRFRIEQIFEGVDYEGGFSFHGDRFLARGDSNNFASLLYYFEEKPIMRVSSRSFSLEEDKFASIDAAVAFYLEDDSIYHPTVRFKFLKESKEVSLLRLDPGLATKPFTNSYHQVEMFFEAMYWKMNESFVRISMVKNSSESAANFRSMSYFSELEYERLQGLDMTHPLIVMRNYFRSKNDKNDFTAKEVAGIFKIDISEARQMLISFSIAGVLNYDLIQEKGNLTEKFYATVNAATRNGDYDQLEFISFYNGDNAQLSLKDFSMDIKGVDKILLSDSQKVFLYPLKQEVVLKKNRDFDFGGTIMAGRFTIYGQNCHFSYENFKIDMEDVDSVVFRVPSFRTNEAGERPIRKVRTSIQDLSGELLIDSPGNKAGLKSFPTYPTLISDKQSYAYYDGKNIENGVYTRDRFYFQVEPFRIDSLDNFANTQIRFAGKLISADIFPDIVEPLKVMPDYSLGFEKNTGSAGLPAYGGKGVFTDTVSLSNMGLRGFGKLAYLTSVLDSRDMIFYPDSMNAFNSTVAIKKSKSGPDNPDVTGAEVSAHWKPYSDSYQLRTTTTPFKMYGGEGAMSGTLDLTTEVLQGDGLFDLINAEFNSQVFEFRNSTFAAETSSFALKDIYAKGADGSQYAFKAENLNANVSFTDRKGKFTFNDPDAFVEFPQNKYKAKMNELIWKMASGTDTASLANSTLDMKGVKFVATAYVTDTLNFNSANASFSLREKIIDAADVQFIDVADSRIFPKDKKVTIRQDAVMDSLANAQVWVGKESKTHVLDSAYVQITSLHQYGGSATYAYIDELGSSQRIYFDSICVNKDEITFGEGILEPTNDFSLSPNFGFRGKVNLYGNNPYLTFTGYVRINHSCEMVSNDYVRFSAELNPKQLLIPVPLEPLNEKNKKLFNGFLFASDTVGLYTAIFTAKKRFTDYELLAADGYLYFDKATQEFVVSRKEKIFDRTLPGNYIAFNTANCNSYGEGYIDMGAKMGQVQIKSAGTIVYEPKEDNTTMDLLMSVDFKLDNSIWKLVTDLIGTGAASFDDEKTARFVADLLDSSKAEKLYSDLTSEGKFKKLPDVLQNGLLLGNVNFKWNKTSKSFTYQGDLDIFAVNGTQVMQQGTGMVELVRKASGDRINMYIEAGDAWIYLSYRSNIMTVYSSSKDLNDAIVNLDAAKKQFQSGSQPLYSFTIGSQIRVDKFKEDFGNQ